MQKSFKDEYTAPIRVVTYGRVSTPHEAQLSAFENQKSNNENIVNSRKNFIWIREYNDSGLSGTTTKRPEFQRMMADAQKGEFDLIITREVCRFARNTVDALKTVRDLRALNVETWFYSDSIWSNDPDGELRLAIFSALAQEESRKVSERALAGQRSSREKGVLYGNGNILAYNLIKGKKSIDNTYVIDPEGAETVRMIFDMYTKERIGARSIATRLVKAKRKDSSGNIRWDSYKVLRILKNRTYAGMISYNKSTTIDYLGHKRKVNPESEIIYKKGKFEPIITDEQWKEAQEIRRRNSCVIDNVVKGKQPAKDRWKKVLRCECGKTFKKYVWRRHKGSGEPQIGYSCRNQVANRSKNFYEANGLDSTGLCNVSSFPRWKLELQLKQIAEKFFINKNELIEELSGVIVRNMSTENESENDSLESELLRKQDKYKLRMKNLLESRLDGIISSKEFLEMKEEIDKELQDIYQQLENYSVKNNKNKARDINPEEIKKQINNFCFDENEGITDDMLVELVKEVTVCDNNTFKWYLFSEDKEIEDFVLVDKFVIDFETARAYRKETGHFLRENQWNDITTEVYMCA